MSQGWSNISISIKSDMLANLLRDHGITPKGAGNIKNGIRFDVDFEWEYSSRYEYMAHDISSVGELIYYYISCVLGVEHGKKLEKLEKAYIQNMDKINDSVECAFYRASVHWDIVAYGEEIYEYQLEPSTRNTGKGTNIFNNPKTVPPSFDNRVLLLGEFAYNADLKVVAAELNVRGWYCCGEFNENYVRFLRGMENIKQPCPDLRQCRYLIVGEKTPMSGELIRHALRQQKKEKFLIIRERDFFAMGAFQPPKYDPITSLVDKTVLIYGHGIDELVRKTGECGGKPIQRYQRNVDICVLPPMDVYEDEFRRCFYSYETTGKPICFTKEEYTELLKHMQTAAPKAAHEIAPQMVGDWTGKVFVINGCVGTIRKKIIEGIESHGGSISKTVNKTVDCLVCSDKWASNSIVKRAYELQASDGKIAIVDEEEFMALLATVHSEKKAEVAPVGPLANKKIVFNGFHASAKKKMAERAVKLGATIQDRASKSTYLVVYNGREPYEFASVTAAKEFNAAGSSILIMDENEFAVFISRLN